MTISQAHIKFVKKANQWCRTTFVDGKQKQEWFGTEEEARKFIDALNEEV